jgi:very-short-patch-repair endonuclease
MEEITIEEYQRLCKPSVRRRKRLLDTGSHLEQTFDALLRLHGADIPSAVAELRFAPPRRWRFDRAWPDMHVAVELEGGIWTNGRHNRPQGYQKDMEKYNAATVEGWAILRFSADMLENDPVGCIALLAELLEIRKKP